LKETSEKAIDNKSISSEVHLEHIEIQEKPYSHSNKNFIGQEIIAKSCNPLKIQEQIFLKDKNESQITEKSDLSSYENDIKENSIGSLNVNEEGHVNLDFQQSKKKKIYKI